MREYGVESAIEHLKAQRVVFEAGLMAGFSLR
jgi:hypothetical protein